jgi:putative Mg2+ transporter-C (MgtC) family protein
LVALSVIGPNEDAEARIVQGLMSGIGFIGGGAILKEGVNVRGTATTASVWTTGALGAAIVYSRYEVAILLCIVNYATLRLLTPVEKEVGKRDRREEERDNNETGT